jgi:hypothetical protein
MPGLDPAIHERSQMFAEVAPEDNSHRSDSRVKERGSASSKTENAPRTPPLPHKPTQPRHPCGVQRQWPLSSQTGICPMNTLRFLVCLAVFALAFPALAEAQAVSCQTLSEQQRDQTWWGRFSGGREVNWSFDGEAIEYTTEEACFPTRRACERWLYEWKNEFGYMPRWNECRRGYAPGAPVKRW